MINGNWKATDAGIGAGVDSYFEYLVKGAILLDEPKLFKLFKGNLMRNVSGIVNALSKIISQTTTFHQASSHICLYSSTKDLNPNPNVCCHARVHAGCQPILDFLESDLALLTASSMQSFLFIGFIDTCV